MIELERLNRFNLENGYQMYCQYLEHFHLSYDRKELHNLLNTLKDFDWLHLLLAKQKTQYVGFCTGVNTFSSISLCLALNLVDLYVCTKFRKKGYGNKLLNLFEIYAKDNNFGKLFVNSDRSSCEFYKKREWNFFDYIYHYKKI